MRKRFGSLLGALASVILIFCILFTGLQVTMNSDFIIRQEYRKLGIAHEVGMSYEDVVASCEQLIHYMEGTVDSIDIQVTVNGQQTLMYTDPQEISHMVDVQLLYQRFRTYRDYGVLAALVLYLLASIISIRTAPHSIAVGYCTGSFIAALFAGFAGTWAALDFSSFWTFFHQSLFWNDDWLFPPSSRMIQILPERFFSDIILYFAIISLTVVFFLLFICLMMLRSERKQKQAAREEILARKKAAKQQHKVQTETDDSPFSEEVSAVATEEDTTATASLPTQEKMDVESCEESHPEEATVCESDAGSPEKEDSSLPEEIMAQTQDCVEETSTLNVQKG